MTGRRVGNFELLGKLGEGSMGVVYRAVDRMVDREVAIKALHYSTASANGAMERLRTEAVALARLNHPAIAQIYTFFAEGAECFLVMEYVPGETLAERLEQSGPLPWPEAVRVAAQLLDGLGHAHARGILHRDVKPGNIMLTPDGRAKILDFGIARMTDGGAGDLPVGRVVGTAAYLAPERIKGQPAPGPASDLYSAAVTIYEMATGHLPFTCASDEELLAAHLRSQPAPLSQWGVTLPPGVQPALLQALEKDPARRPASARELALALGPGGLVTPGASNPAGSWRLAAAVLVAALVLSAMAAAWLRQRTEAQLAEAWLPTAFDVAPATAASANVSAPLRARIPYIAPSVTRLRLEAAPGPLLDTLTALLREQLGTRVRLETGAAEAADAVLHITATEASYARRAAPEPAWRVELDSAQSSASQAAELVRRLRAQLTGTGSDNVNDSVR